MGGQRPRGTERVLKLIKELAASHPAVDITGQTFDASFAFEQDDVKRHNMEAFPGYGKARGAEQDAQTKRRTLEINKLAFKIIKDVFKGVVIELDDPGFIPDEYDDDDSEQHVRTAQQIKERSPLAAIALDKIEKGCTSQGMVWIHLRTKILSYTGPTTLTKGALQQHTKMCNSIAEQARLYEEYGGQMLGTAKEMLQRNIEEANRNDKTGLKYEAFMTAHNGEESLVTYIGALRDFVKKTIVGVQELQAEKNGIPKVTANNVATTPSSTCPIHPQGKHKAEDCIMLKKLAQNNQGQRPGTPNKSQGQRPAPGHPSAFKRKDGPKVTFRQGDRGSAFKFKKGNTQDKRPAEQQRLDPEGRFKGKHFDKARWNANHVANHVTIAAPEAQQAPAPSVNGQQVANAIAAAMHINAFCVAPIQAPDTIEASTSESKINIESINITEGKMAEDEMKETETDEQKQASDIDEPVYSVYFDDSDDECPSMSSHDRELAVYNQHENEQVDEDMVEDDVPKLIADEDKEEIQIDGAKEQTEDAETRLHNDPGVYGIGPWWSNDPESFHKHADRALSKILDICTYKSAYKAGEIKDAQDMYEIKVQSLHTGIHEYITRLVMQTPLVDRWDLVTNIGLCVEHYVIQDWYNTHGTIKDMPALEDLEETHPVLLELKNVIHAQYATLKLEYDESNSEAESCDEKKQTVTDHDVFGTDSEASDSSSSCPGMIGSDTDSADECQSMSSEDSSDSQV